VIFWTHGKIEELRRLLADKNSAKEAAEILGCTRNAVIGKSHRLGINSGLNSSNSNRVKNAHAERKTKSATILAKGVVMTPQPSLEPIEALFPLPQIETPMGAAAAIMSLTPDSCRWPLGNPLDDTFRFCGCKAAFGKPYCLEHYRASCGNGTPSERRVSRPAWNAPV
jgi:GcrA cell cycle regulator